MVGPVAKRTTVVVQDSLDGTEGATTVKFGLDGRSYEIDLSEKNEKALRKTLEKYLDAATQVAKSPAAAGGRQKYGTGPVRRDTTSTSGNGCAARASKSATAAVFRPTSCSGTKRRTQAADAEAVSGGQHDGTKDDGGRFSARR